MNRLKIHALARSMSCASSTDFSRSGSSTVVNTMPRNLYRNVHRYLLHRSIAADWRRHERRAFNTSCSVNNAHVNRYLDRTRKSRSGVQSRPVQSRPCSLLLDEQRTNQHTSCRACSERTADVAGRDPQPHSSPSPSKPKPVFWICGAVNHRVDPSRPPARQPAISIPDQEIQDCFKSTAL